MKKQKASANARNLFFIRSHTALVADEVFAEKPDVWVFGDVEGYEFFCRELERAIKGGRPRTLVQATAANKSMNLVLMPAASIPTRVARLRVIERFVWIDGEVVQERADSEFEHLHLNDWDENWIEPYSVALNVRAPSTAWTQDWVPPHYWDAVYNGTDHSFPRGEEWFKTTDPIPYRLPSVRGNRWLSLAWPAKKKKRTQKESHG